jgi:hypothetical protein
LSSDGKVTRPDELITAKIVSPLQGILILKAYCSCVQEVDRELKRACEETIEYCRDQSVAGLKAFTDKATRYLASKRGSGPGSDLPSQPWATNDQLKAVVDEFQRTCQQTVKTWMSNLRLYLQDEATVQVLFPPLQVSTGRSCCSPSLGLYFAGPYTGCL